MASSGSKTAGRISYSTSMRLRASSATSASTAATAATEKYSNVTVKAKDNKVVLGIVYDGKERELSFLSGGERIALGLAFRLALSLYLAGEIPLLIMDEPTPYLDDERRRRLVDIMECYLKKIPQVIIVSHDEELKDAADKVVRIRLENGVSKVEEVEVC